MRWMLGRQGISDNGYPNDRPGMGFTPHAPPRSAASFCSLL
jgi:hypothetical protein